MPFNPYPSPADLNREAAATVRDLADLCALRELRGIVANALSRAGRVDDIHHPERRWSAADLLEVLEGELANIDGEVQRIRRGPVVIEDEG
jgi:hypothetical protein